jgi:tetratricopeptide (TPR) repeat protein
MERPTSTGGELQPTSPSPDTDLTSDLHIVPGLSGLNLNILHAIDMHMIDNAKHTIFKWIQKEHRIVANVQKTMVALLKTKIPRETREARIELEQIVRESPRHLNALADLETIYRNLYRITDADRCRRTIDSILKSTSDADVQIKRTCLLEQGYAILIERTIVNKNTLELRISDMHKILTVEYDKSDGERRECLGRGLHHQKQVLCSIHSGNKDNTTDAHLIRKASSLQKFEMAENFCSDPLPHPLWEHYHAKALNQYYNSLERLSPYKDGGLEAEMRAVTINALEMFWSVAQMPMDEDNKKIVARSFVYIGQILTKRESLVRSGEQTFELSKNPEFKLYLHNPLEALRKAYRLKPNDISVLNRYGRTLWHRSLAMKNWNNVDQKLEYLEDANKKLSASINVDSDRNWFPYTTRMQVRLDIADIVIQHNPNKAKSSLENAKKDGHICFKSQNTRRDMTVLAETCQKLAKFPSLRDYGPEFVKTEHYLHEALDYLFYVTHLGDPIDYHWTNRISSCLFDLGEYEKAIEWQRKRWLLSAPSNSNSFYILCIYMLTRYAKDDNLKTSMETFLREFLYVLTYGKNKYKDITRNIEGIYKNRPYEICKLLTAVIVENVITVREDEKNILQHCLNILIQIASRNKRRNIKTFYREFQRLMATLRHIFPSEENEYVLSDIFENSPMFPFPKRLRCRSSDFKFDFFVCHSHKDSDWVHNMLLRHLESTFDQQDISFKGMYNILYVYK